MRAYVSSILILHAIAIIIIIIVSLSLSLFYFYFIVREYFTRKYLLFPRNCVGFHLSSLANSNRLVVVDRACAQTRHRG